MPNLQITANSFARALSVDTRDDAVFRLDHVGGVTVAPLGFFGKIFQQFGKGADGARIILDALADDLQTKYGSEVGRNAFVMARATYGISDTTKPLTVGQWRRTQEFAKALTKNQQRDIAANSALRYAPGAAGFAKIARDAGVDPERLSVPQKEQYQRLLQHQVGMASPASVVDRRDQFAIAVRTLQHVAAMNATEVRSSNAWLTRMRDAGIDLAKSIADPGAKPVRLVQALCHLQDVAMERLEDVGLGGTERPYLERGRVQLAVGMAITSAMTALSLNAAHDLYSAAMAKGGAGRMLLFATSVNSESEKFSLSSSNVGSKILHETNQALLVALAERGGIEHAESEIRKIEELGTHLGRGPGLGIGLGDARLTRVVKEGGLSGSRDVKRFVEAVYVATKKQVERAPSSVGDKKGETAFPSQQVFTPHARKAAPAGPSAASAPTAERGGIRNILSMPAVAVENARKTMLYQQIVGDVRRYLASNAFADRLNLEDQSDDETTAAAIPHIRTMVTAEVDRRLAERIANRTVLSVLSGEEIANLVDECLKARADMTKAAIADARLVSHHMGNVLAAGKDYTKSTDTDEKAKWPMTDACQVFSAAMHHRGTYLRLRAADSAALEREIKAVSAEIRKIEGRSKSDPHLRQGLVAWKESLELQFEEIKESAKMWPLNVTDRAGSEITDRGIMAAMAVGHWAQAQPAEVAQNAGRLIEAMRKAVGDGPASAILSNLSKWLNIGAGIAEGEGKLDDLPALEQALSVPNLAAAFQTEEQPLSNGGKVTDAFWNDVSRVKYLVEGTGKDDPSTLLYDPAGVVTEADKAAAVRQAAEKLHDFAGDRDLAEKLSQILHQGLSVPLLGRLKSAITFRDEPGIVGFVHAGDLDEIRDNDLTIAVRKNADGSIRADIVCEKQIGQFSPMSSQRYPRYLDPAKSYLRVSASVNFSWDGRLTLVRDPPPNYSYRMVETDTPPVLSTSSRSST